MSLASNSASLSFFEAIWQSKDLGTDPLASVVGLQQKLEPAPFLQFSDDNCSIIVVYSKAALTAER